MSAPVYFLASLSFCLRNTDKKEIKFVVVVAVGGDVVQIDVVVVKQLKIPGLHVLPGVEADGKLLFQWVPPRYEHLAAVLWPLTCDP